MTIKRKVLTASLIAVALTSTACMPRQVKVFHVIANDVRWNKEGISQSMMKKTYVEDKSQCSQELSNTLEGIYDPAFAQGSYEACLMKKGWNAKLIRYEDNKLMREKFRK